MAHNSGKLGYNTEGSSQKQLLWDHNYAQGIAGEIAYSDGTNEVQGVKSSSM
jgi:hypothetical protein